MAERWGWLRRLRPGRHRATAELRRTDGGLLVSTYVDGVLIAKTFLQPRSEA